MKSNKYLKITFYCAVGLIISFLIFNFIFVDIIRLDYDFSVKEGTVGFNVDNDKLYFGSISKEGASKRDIIIENPYSKSRVNIKSYGDFSDFIFISENNFIIKKGETKELEVILDLLNSNIEYGHYKGKIIIFLTRF